MRMLCLIMGFVSPGSLGGSQQTPPKAISPSHTQSQNSPQSEVSTEAPVDMSKEAAESPHNKQRDSGSPLYCVRTEVVRLSTSSMSNSPVAATSPHRFLQLWTFLRLKRLILMSRKKMKTWSPHQLCYQSNLLGRR